MNKTTRTLPESKRAIDSYTDEEFRQHVWANLFIGERFPKSIYKIYDQLKLKIPANPAEREYEKKYLKRFFSWETAADTVIITDIYEEPKPVKNISKNPKTEKIYNRFDEYKGYKDDDEFMNRVSERLHVQQEYKGYKELCSILSVQPQKGANTVKHQDDWHRFFNWEVKSQRKWIITEIYDMPQLITGKSSRSVYADGSSKLLAKRLYNDSPCLQNMRLAKPADNHSMDIMMKRDNVASIIGLNNKVLTENEIKYDEDGELSIISKFVKKFDEELCKNEIEHTQKDISVFRDQMTMKFRRVIESGLTDLKNKGIIVRFAYTELYYNVKTKSYGALFENSHLDVAVSEHKTAIMGRYGIYDWKYFPKLSEIQKISLMKELNNVLEEDLGIKISYGYWIRLNLRMLNRYYNKDNINLIDEKEMKENLKEIIRQRQEKSAEKTAAQIQTIYDNEQEYMTQHSNNYIKVSSELFDSVFKADEKIKILGHLYLTADKMEFSDNLYQNE